jgi:hypothetical protein
MPVVRILRSPSRVARGGGSVPFCVHSGTAGGIRSPMRAKMVASMCAYFCLHGLYGLALLAASVAEVAPRSLHSAAAEGSTFGCGCFALSGTRVSYCAHLG